MILNHWFVWAYDSTVLLTYIYGIVCGPGSLTISNTFNCQCLVLSHSNQRRINSILAMLTLHILMYFCLECFHFHKHHCTIKTWSKSIIHIHSSNANKLYNILSWCKGNWSLTFSYRCMFYSCFILSKQWSFGLSVVTINDCIFLSSLITSSGQVVT